MEALAIIPARSGSKSIKDKNIRLINQKPMLAYSIEHAKSAKMVSRVIVSTDSEKYAEIAKKYGAEVPFLRPAELATDLSLDIDVFEHALKTLKEKENYIPDIVIHLRPTYPIRNSNDIDNMVRMLIENNEADSIRCITKANEIPYKMWRLETDGRIVPLLTDIPEAYNMPRQELPQIFYQNACIDVIRASTIMKKRSMTGDKIFSYVMKQNFDIDTEADFIKASKYLEILQGNKKFVFDIDGVVAKYRKELDYNAAEPDEETIRLINKLYDLGNYIVLFTARGYKTGIDWTKVTAMQMQEWRVKYHELIYGKPDADYYIDDKMQDLDELKAMFMGDK